MGYTEIVITKPCKGSEDGIHVRVFNASPNPQPVEEKLARVFVAKGWAVVSAAGQPAARETKVVAPETKVVAPVEKKRAKAVSESENE